MRSRKFKFKVDPRDISSVYLYDERAKIYIQIPNADPAFGPISLEEYEYLRKILRRNGFKEDTAAIMEAHEHLADLIKGSTAEKRRLLNAQKKARSRADNLAEQPGTSQNTEESCEEKKEPWVPKDFEIEV